MQRKSEIFKKRNFLGQALDFLPHKKPGLYISRVDFFKKKFIKYFLFDCFFVFFSENETLWSSSLQKNIELKENTSLPNSNVMEYNLELWITNYLNKMRRESS